MSYNYIKKEDTFVIYVFNTKKGVLFTVYITVIFFSTNWIKCFWPIKKNFLHACIVRFYVIQDPKGVSYVILDSIFKNYACYIFSENNADTLKINHNIVAGSLDIAPTRNCTHFLKIGFVVTRRRWVLFLSYPTRK